MQRNKPTTAARRIGRKCPALLAGALLLGAASLRAQGPELFVFWDFNDASNPTVATDKILGVPGELLNGAVFSAPGLGHTGNADDMALDLGFSQDGAHMDVTKAGFLNLAAADDKMTVSFWLVWNADITAGSSAFWMVSPSSVNNQRGAQAHVPWSDNNIYFDTAGCCDGATQRISASITSFPDYFDGFFFLWHHFAFVKDGSTKRIYIDGKLFLEGTNTSPLPQDFTELIVGNLFTKNSSVAGLIDDFAVFGSALTEAEVAALASGTPPDQLPGVTFPAEPVLLSATPAAGPGAEPDAPVAIEILEGASPIDPASVKLTIDGQEITGAQVSKTGKTVKINYQPATIWAPLSAHSVQVDFNDGHDRSITYDFQTVNYGVLTAADKVEADTTKPGFVFRIHQGTDNTTSLARAETQLSGNDGDNLANPAAPGPALGHGTPGPTPQSPIQFEIATVINMEKTGLDAGEFNPNDTFPGIDGSSSAGYNGTAAEILTYAELPAGMVHLVVNSDDGFQVAAGNVRDVLRRQVGGEFNGSRGAADSLVRLYVEEAGIYPLRIVYFQGSGGASLELKMVKPDGTRVLLNDVANGSVPCYRATTSPTPSAVVAVSPAPGQTGVEPDAPIQVVIQAGDTPVDPATVKLLVDGQDVGAAVNQNGNQTTVSYQPTALWASGQTYTVGLQFTAETARTDEWKFTVKTYYPNTLLAYWPFNDASSPDTAFDVVGHVPASLQNGAAFTPDAGGFSGQPGDRAIDFGPDANQQLVSIDDVSWLATAIQRDQVTVSFWHKAAATGVNQTAVWFVSPSSSGTMRGLGLQTPWSNNGIYYDTGGCCNGTTQRINRSITQFEDYTDDSFWLQWHHFAVTKNGPVKKIYIDGKLFHQGQNTLPLPADINQILLGAEPPTGDPPTHNNSMIGLMDDFAVFGNELFPQDIAQLAAGASPLDLVPAAAPSFTSITLANGQVVIEWQGEGTLETAETLDGPWTPVAGATSPYTTAPASGHAFFRLKQ